MTEQTNFADVNAGSQDSSAAAASNASNVTNSPVASHDAAGGQVNTTSQPNDYAWIGREKAAAEKRGYEKALKELEASKQNHSQQMGGMSQVSPDEIERLVEQKIQLREQQNQSLNIANGFLNKLSTGESKYEDFKQVMGSFNLQEFAKTAPAVFHLVNSADNTADIMYELANNPKKIADLQYTAQMNPIAAQRELATLSESIKINNAAKQHKSPQEPLPQIKASTVGVDNGSSSISDLRRDPSYKV